MFSRKERLIKRTGPDGVGRYEFLKQLVTEFTTTKSFEAKRQTLANLANFAYDPINFEYIKQLHITDLFLAQLSEDSEELIHFALAGLCNLSCDPELKDYIVKLNGANLIKKYLLHDNVEIALNALSTIYYLITEENKSSIIDENLRSKLIHYQKSVNPRLSSLGAAFTRTYPE